MVTTLNLNLITLACYLSLPATEREDPYLFIHEFEEVCALQKLQQLTEDSIRLRLINFALKENAKNGCIAYQLTLSQLGRGLLSFFLKNIFQITRPPKSRMRLTNFIKLKMSHFENILIDLRTSCPNVLTMA